MSTTSNSRTLLTAISNILTRKATLSRDEYGIPRRWSYNPEDFEERNALKSFLDYVEGHNITPRHLEVFTKNNRVFYCHDHVVGGIQLDRIRHYLINPQLSKTHSYNKYEDGRSGVDWSISFNKARGLDPEAHLTCPFKNQFCDYCDGPNATTIG